MLENVLIGIFMQMMKLKIAKSMMSTLIWENLQAANTQSPCLEEFPVDGVTLVYLERHLLIAEDQ